MGFRSNTYGWKATAARLLLVPVLAGSAGTAAKAQFGGTAVQSGGSAEKARYLTAQANRALQSGDTANAEKLARQAVDVGATLAADEPQPANILADIARRKAAAAPAGGTAAGQAPGAKTADPKDVLKLAKQAFAAGQYDQAQDYAAQADQAAAARGYRWGLFDDTPAGLKKDIADARAKSDKTKAEQLFKDAKTTAVKAAKTDAERIANLESALQMAYQSKNLHGPYSMWDFGDKPDKLITEIETAKAALRKKTPAGYDAALAAKSAQPKLPAPTLTAPKTEMPRVAALPAPTLNPPTMTGPAIVVPAMTAPSIVAPVMTAAANPAKEQVARLVAEGRMLLGQEKVVEAKAKAAEARKLADDARLTTAFTAAEDTPDQLYAAVQSKGKETIDALTKDADRQVAAKDYAKADAALKYAQEIGTGIGVYTQGVEDKRAAVAKAMNPAGVVAAGNILPLPTEVAVAPPAMPRGLMAPGVGGVVPPAMITPPAVTAPALVAAAPVLTAPSLAPPVMTAPTLTPPMLAAPAVAVAPPMLAAPGAGEYLVPAGPPMAVLGNPAPTLAAAPALAPAGSTPGGKVLLAQAEAEMRRGDLDMARKIAYQAHNGDPACKADAQALLRLIDAEDFAVKRTNAKAAFESGMAMVAGKKYDAAAGVFKLIDPAQLPMEMKLKLADVTADCVAKSAAPAGAVALAGMEQPAPAAPGVAKIGGGDTLAGQHAALAEVGYQKLRQDGFEALNAATAAWGRGETTAALQALSDYANKVKASTQSPSRQAMLLRPIDERTARFQIMKHHADFLVGEAKDKTDARRDVLTAGVAEAQKQDEIKKRVRQINELTKAGKFKEAEIGAAQLRQLDPEDPTLGYMADQTKHRRRSEEFKGLRDGQERFNLVQLNEVEKVGPPVTLENPLSINPEAARRAAMRGEDQYLRTRTPGEMVIEQRLNAPFSFKFENASLRTVISEIRQKTQLNIVTDDASIDDEKISLDELKINEEVKDISLRDGLTILLAKARLAHVVENNVVKVTTEKRSRGRLTTKVFHVMDLVTPVPEFAPAPHQRLDTALALARGAGGFPGASAGATSGGSLPTPFVPNSGLKEGTMVSGGQGFPGSSAANGGTMVNQLQSGPVAMSPQRGAYSEQLKKLITGMVRPFSWQTLGGPGNVDYYDIGGALVVNQTADVLREVNDLLESLRRLQDLSVAVEVRVISLSEAFFERVGVDFALNVKTNNASFERQIATSQFKPEPFLNDINARGVVTGYNPAAGGFTSDLGVPIRSTSYGLSIPSFGGYQGALSPTNNGGLALGLAFLNDIQVYMFLEAAQGNRRVNVMQAPKITLFNGQTSTVFVGDVAYFTTGLQVYNVGGQFVYLPTNTAFPIGGSQDLNGNGQTGVSVTVQAVISADRRFVRLNLAPSLTALASATVPLFPISTFITPVFEGGSQGQPIPFTQFFQQPSFSQIEAQTTVAVPDGGTVLLGGLKTLAQSRNEFGPPVISQVPYLNRLFKNVGVGQETRHVMMMVTPRIIINSEEEARQVQEGGGQQQ